MTKARKGQLHKSFATGIKRAAALCLAAVLFAGIFAPALPAGVVSAKKDPMFRLSAAKKLAVSVSENLESLELQVSAKQAARQSSIKSLKEKQRNMSTFRWSPLLNFKFPTKPNEAEAFTFQFKPTQLQYQINIVKHKMNDEKLKIYEKVSNTYISIITAQQAMKYDNERITKLTETYGKLQAKLVEGSVTKEKVDKAQTALENAQSQLANDQTQFERSKQKMSEQIGMDVTTGYRFEEAFVTADLSRDYIPLLQSKAIEKDQSVYEASIAEEEALLALRINYSLMSSQYGSYMGLINTYVDQALAGEKINKKAFKKDYDTFVQRIDERWQGHYRFLFIKIPKEWLKGDLDGVRYIEDDPYVLYTAALDYESARKECENTKTELKNAVAEGYDSYAEARKSYVDLNKTVSRAVKNLAVSEAKNVLGELSDDEFEAEKKEVESQQSELNDVLSTYSSTLYSYDRTCCGAVSAYLRGGGAGDREESLSSIIQKGVTYTLRPIVSSQEFLLSLNVPDDFEAKSGMHITQFSLHSDGRQIGQRTQLGSALRHLELTVEDVGRVTVRIYDGDTFLDECEIDPTVYIGDLNITTGYETGANPHVIGKYTVSDDLATDMVSITFAFEQDRVMKEYTSGEAAAYYNIATDTGSFLRSEDKIAVDEPFEYLSFIKGDIGELVLHIYDSNKEEIGVAVFADDTKELVHEVTEQEAQAIAQQKEEQAKQEAIDEEKLKAEQEAAAKRKKAEETLKRLGFEVNDTNMAYALAHIRELTYAADLMDSNADMQKSYEKDKQTLEDGRKSGMSEDELNKLQKRLDSYVAMQAKQQDTINSLDVLNELKKMNGQR